MANKNPCPICELGEEVCKEIQRREEIGLPASETVGYLATKGYKQTQRELIAHRRHVVALKSPRLVEVALVAPDVPSRPSMSSPDLSDREREERLLESILAATEMMLETLKTTGSIKISRAAVELGSLAHQILNAKLARVTETDPVINIVFSRKRLEDNLPDHQPSEET